MMLGTAEDSSTCGEDEPELKTTASFLIAIVCDMLILIKPHITILNMLFIFDFF